MRLSLAALFALAASFRPAATDPARLPVSGPLTIDGRPVPLAHADRDDTDPGEPIVVLSDEPLPVEAVPFIPEKLVEEKHLHALAFGVSRNDRSGCRTSRRLST
jgi:hypothetical protein